MKSIENFLFFVLIFSLIIFTSSVVIEIENGLIEGSILKTRKNVNFYAFRGIPYAEKPIGDLRFKPPVEKLNWNGTLDATEYGSRCTQLAMERYGFPDEVLGQVFGDEDCLFLNVFTKNLRSEDLKPVIVFIHGGGFEIGYAHQYDPKMLLDRDVVVVTIQYRLGPFGFLALGTADAPGNYGLKDQNLALKWIKKNIPRFNGDPNKVTIAGSSAGGFSITAHMVSEMSRGLFHRVIAVSGAITWQTKLDESHIDEAQKLAVNVGCPTKIETMVKCLRTKSAEEIAKGGFIDFYGCPILPWVPVVEPDFGQERFLSSEPNLLFKVGNFTKIPVIAGIVESESIIPVKIILKSEAGIKALNDDFPNFASRCFFFKENGKHSLTQMSESIRDRYFPFVDKIDKRNINSLTQLASDGMVGYGVHKFVHFASEFTKVFYYQSTYKGRYSNTQHPRNHAYGVGHLDDLQYIFKVEFIEGSIQESDPENIMVERMTRIWENFAKTGTPNNSSDEFLSEMIWPKHNSSDEFYLDIGTFMIEKQGLNLERYAVWDNFETDSSLRLKVGWSTIFLLILGVFI